MEKSYIQKKAFALAMLMLVLGGLNIGSMFLFKTDILSYMFGKKTFVTNVIVMLIVLSAVCIGFHRDTYLPFLGTSVMPCSLLNPQVPTEADFEFQLALRPGSKVLYWAAEPANHELQFVQNWKKAYRDFKNAGVTVADHTGNASLKVRKPQSYSVPFKGELQPHIHYRVCEDLGMMGPVQTITLDEREYFENVVAAQETPEPVLNPSAAPLPPAPETAMHRLNEQAKYTAQMARMIQTGALHEFPTKTMGAELDSAFAETE